MMCCAWTASIPDLAWTASIPDLAGMAVQPLPTPTPLDSASRILTIVYMILASLAALKYLLGGGQYKKARFSRNSRQEENRSYIGTFAGDFVRRFHWSRKASRRPRRVPPTPDHSIHVPEPEPEPVHEAFQPGPERKVEPFMEEEPAGETEEPVQELPDYPKANEITGTYELENPGYSPNPQYGVRLKPSVNGVLLAREFEMNLVCVYIRNGTNGASDNLKRQGLQSVFELLDADGRKLSGFPAGTLKLMSVAPATCKHLGYQLKLMEKGQMKVLEVE